jgi:hypothetical protein
MACADELLDVDGVGGERGVAAEDAGAEKRPQDPLPDPDVCDQHHEHADRSAA